MKKLEEALRWCRKRKLVAVAVGTLSLLSLVVLEEKGAFSAGGDNVRGSEERIRVVVDAGHGGMDPGKVGINGANEKEINLQIAEYLRQYLEANDIEVVMTRETDEGLNDADASNKKVQDMKRRIELIDETAPAITVSIHQNSYPEEYVHGAQVFYYTGSKEGQALAQSIQEELVAKLDPENKRQVKENDSYYLLKKTGIPIVIVECGFLSNSAEAEKLCTEAYQKRVAWAIHMGILRYLNTRQ
ncbi:MAG: N-acetylmuramoyl-L-alanine amidase [Eubacterium sp.]|nr:N-acetylmuramoyl-L-alanine amidase [Eubacterium sp.]MCM1215819.1 N-acetylmuramoyl-L-alanine amidase [Lachnospiraceae bacterium]MCM1304859.1 N-acetylmuramoyl-L-alanine amidase [Butyrivibrio sp.]MCM1344445.1 N-acetylmuramoyl-L-alanine amidase [Muribaculaceae bacterium]MCM1239199.1 N-acetylmuramoyl-L-alanine amidase [Lachnospiraceae bacterium]